jgi:hypothetical protein
MRPDSVSTIIRPDLGFVLYEYMFNPLGFQMRRALPIFKTPEKSGEYPAVKKEGFIKLPEKMARAPRTAYTRDELEFTMKDYSTEDRGLEMPLDDTERKLYRNLIDAELVITEAIGAKMLRKHEIAGTTLLTDTSSFENEAAAKKWNLKAECDPRSDIRAQKKKIRDTTGIEADSVILSKTSFEDILDCAAFLDQCKGVMVPQLMSYDEQIAMVSKYLSVNKIIVIGEVKDTSKNPRSSTISDIWPSTLVMVAKTADSPENLREACVGRTFLWEEESPDMLVMESYREEKIRSNVYRGRGYMGEKIVCAELGKLITGTR